MLRGHYTTFKLIVHQLSLFALHLVHTSMRLTFKGMPFSLSVERTDSVRHYKTCIQSDSSTCFVYISLTAVLVFISYYILSPAVIFRFKHLFFYSLFNLLSASIKTQLHKTQHFTVLFLCTICIMYTNIDWHLYIDTSMSNKQLNGVNVSWICLDFRAAIHVLLCQNMLYS